MKAPEAANVERFAQATHALRTWLKSAPAMSPTTCRDLAHRLADLCALALRLPEHDAPDVPRPKHDVEPLDLDFGELDFYREIFDAYAEDEPVVGSLSDDVRDVYSDLMQGLAIFERGQPADLRAAAWTWRESFYGHWGEHATSALRALYWVLRRSS